MCLPRVSPKAGRPRSFHPPNPLPPLQRPSLLLDGEWQRVPGGVAALAARYSEAEAARLAAAEPLLLAEDLEHVLQELGRCAACSFCLPPQLANLQCWATCRGLTTEWEQPPPQQQRLRQPARDRRRSTSPAGPPPLPRPRRRLMPQQPARELLLAQPSLAGQVSRLQHLSLW